MQAAIREAAEEIGVQIEDPFGRLPNDLPLDEICASLDGELRAALVVPSGTSGYDRESA